MTICQSAIMTNDHLHAIHLAAEDLADVVDDSRRLYLLLGVIIEKLEGECRDAGTALALAHIARDNLLRAGGLHEACECIAHLVRDFPLPAPATP